MKITHLILPSLAIAGAIGLLLPTDSHGYSLIGGSLGQAQRDFRIFDNFLDAAANNNTVADSQFPGYTGAEMAIWKASIEWGSLHGNGNGDPSQNGGLGSGGANFDPSFQGNALSTGNTNQNIHSSQASCGGGGTLAYTETPISDGWRIRYCDEYTWQDGPGTSIGGGNNIDLQGVACHEYGHALGLGHSGSSGATMFPTISGSGVGQRSIHSDDIAGVQAIYGVAAANKPRITDVITAGSTVIVTGTNFSGSGNEVWFTQAGAGGNGIPIKVTNAGSAGGTISVTLPGTAGPGDILVRRNGFGHADLSNAWPYDPTITGCPPPSNFCISSPNSVGPGMIMDYSGTNLMSSNNLQLIAQGGPASAPGIFYFGTMQTAVPFGNGWRCIGGSVFRLPAVQCNIFGEASIELDLTISPGNNITAGNWLFQFWYRNVAGGGAQFNLSDGLDVEFCP